ncbi:serine hydrolase [Bacteroides zoogleoformans]|uniref:serine hydrolase n=1 Tax=Bacteroides zoogleoformans TaxID=28119 RepID=UPI00248D449A|nr:serine hydrolase [Bacteroides zoogleoformans]
MKSIKLLLWILSFIVGASSLHAQTKAPVLSLNVESQCRQWVDSVFTGLSLQEKVGQLIVATMPAEVDKTAKKQIREWVRKYKVGSLLFSAGTPEEQTILANIARKESKIPVMMAIDGEWGASIRLKDSPEYPGTVALGCIEDRKLVEGYEREVARQFRQLGIHTNLAFTGHADVDLLKPVTHVSLLSKSPYEVTETLLAGNDVVRVKANVKDAVHELTAALEDGRLSQKELENKCRKVLTYKYMLGLRKQQPQLQVSGMSYRVNTKAARDLAGKLRCASVTVLSNYFDVLPLDPVEGNMAILSVGEQEWEKPFVERMKVHAGIDHFYLSGNADEAARQAIAERLKAYRRVIVCVVGSVYISERDMAFLEGLHLRAPLVYTCFTSHRMLQLFTPALTKSSAVVWAPTADADLQRYVADVLFAKAVANGKISVNVGHFFPAGTGCVIEPGMESGKNIPEDYGMKSYVLQRIDSIVQKGLEAGAYPGCCVLVWKDGKPIYDKQFGTHSDKDAIAVRPSDLFDLASLTKTTATLLAVMKLYDERKIRLDDKISTYLPFLRAGDKQHITIRELLLHESGLSPYVRFYEELIEPNSVHGPYLQSWLDKWHTTRVSENSYYSSDFKFKKNMISAKRTSEHSLHMAENMWLNKNFKNTILQRIVRSELDRKRYVHSDLGFVLLQQLVETCTGMSMDAYLAKEFYAPMGLQRTLFLPLTKFAKTEIMPTAANDFLRRQDLCGYVHDEIAACMGGVSGSAGLFSTAEEVAKIYQMLLDGGEFNGKRFLSETTCRLFTTEKSVISRRGLGFDKPDLSILKNSPCSASAPASVYGHTGFTGTAVWVDPDNKMIYVFLSNRLCPNVWNTKLGDMYITKSIQDLIYESLKE